jgi:cytochrome c biogenesis protein CcdA/glutaredoxin
MKKTGLILFVILLASIASASAAVSVYNNTTGPTVEMVVFYGKGCPHCAQLELFLDKIAPNYPELKIIKKEIYFNDTNRDLLYSLSEKYNVEVGGVPTVFIHDKVIVGFSDAISKQLETAIKECIDYCIATGQHMQIIGDSSPTEDPDHTNLANALTIPAVISAAAVDAINPCEFAVLIILLTTIIASGNRKKALFAGLAFSASIFISYFLMGLGLYSAISAAKFTHTIYFVFAGLAVLIGIFNLKDYLWYGKWFAMEVPMSWRPRMKLILKSVTSVPGAFLVGFVISLFLLPCTSGPYIVILGLLAKVATRNHAISLLLLYNAIFVLPMILITLAIYFGLITTEKAEEWRNKKIKTLHLIAGAILLSLGIAMFIALGFGWM